MPQRSNLHTEVRLKFSNFKHHKIPGFVLGLDRGEFSGKANEETILREAVKCFREVIDDIEDQIGEVE